MNTVDRLRGYGYAFDETVIDQVGEFAERQQAYTDYRKFLADMRVGEPTKWSVNGSSKPIEVLDIRPDEHDSDEVLALHLPMGVPLDENILYSTATLAGVMPHRRLVAVANPSGPGCSSGLLNRRERRRVAAHDLSPVVDPLLKYLGQSKVQRVDHVGLSYGAEKAAVAASKDMHEVRHLVSIEPVSAIKRSLGKLATDFGRSNKVMEQYNSATELPTFNEARKDSIGFRAYLLGLGRLTNVAVARGLTGECTLERLFAAMHEHPPMRTTIAWGTASELVPDQPMQAIVKKLQAYRNEEQVQPIRLEGQHHAMCSDLHLYAAIVLQALRD